MGSITTLRNTPVIINLPSDFSDNGWAISGGIATHSACNSGPIRLYNANVVNGKTYTARYRVLTCSSGYVCLFIGTTEGIHRTVPGEYTETILCTQDGVLYFYSDANCSIEYLTYFEPATGVVPARTIAFSENKNRWVTDYSYTPEFMIRFIDAFFIGVGGELWEQNVNEVRNNFCGVQYPSMITFYVNLSPKEVKTFYSFHQNSNKVWSVPEIEIPAREGKPNGQRSRLKKLRFNRLQGQWFADFMKDLSDPRFDTELEALISGADLQGEIMKITIRNDDTVEVRLLAVDTTFSKQNYTK